jgi:hypothetical protein
LRKMATTSKKPRLDINVAASSSNNDISQTNEQPPAPNKILRLQASDETVVEIDGESAKGSKYLEGLLDFMELTEVTDETQSLPLQLDGIKVEDSGRTLQLVVDWLKTFKESNEFVLPKRFDNTYKSLGEHPAKQFLVNLSFDERQNLLRASRFLIIPFLNYSVYSALAEMPQIEWDDFCLLSDEDLIETLRFWSRHRIHGNLRNSERCKALRAKINAVMPLRTIPTVRCEPKSMGWMPDVGWLPDALNVIAFFGNNNTQWIADSKSKKASKIRGFAIDTLVIRMPKFAEVEKYLLAYLPAFLFRRLAIHLHDNEDFIKELGMFLAKAEFLEEFEFSVDGYMPNAELQDLLGRVLQTLNHLNPAATLQSITLRYIHGAPMKKEKLEAILTTMIDTGVPRVTLYLSNCSAHFLPCLDVLMDLNTNAFVAVGLRDNSYWDDREDTEWGACIAQMKQKGFEKAAKQQNGFRGAENSVYNGKTSTNTNVEVKWTGRSFALDYQYEVATWTDSENTRNGMVTIKITA